MLSNQALGHVLVLHTVYSLINLLQCQIAYTLGTLRLRISVHVKQTCCMTAKPMHVNRAVVCVSQQLNSGVLPDCCHVPHFKLVQLSICLVTRHNPTII